MAERPPRMRTAPGTGEYHIVTVFKGEDKIAGIGQDPIANLEDKGYVKHDEQRKWVQYKIPVAEHMAELNALATKANSALRGSTNSDVERGGDGKSRVSASILSDIEVDGD